MSNAFQNGTDRGLAGFLRSLITSGLAHTGGGGGGGTPTPPVTPPPNGLPPGAIPMPTYSQQWAMQGHPTFIPKPFSPTLTVGPIPSTSTKSTKSTNNR